MPQNLNAQKQSQEKEFLSICQNISPKQSDLFHSLNVLKKSLRSKNCALLFKALDKKTSLRLYNKKLHDISLLNFFPKITKLDLRKNNIKDGTVLMK